MDLKDIHTLFDEFNAVFTEITPEGNIVFQTTSHQSKHPGCSERVRLMFYFHSPNRRVAYDANVKDLLNETDLIRITMITNTQQVVIHGRSFPDG